MCLGKQRRLQFVECPNDINGMLDAAKYADLALLLIDGSYGFEMVRYCWFLLIFATLLAHPLESMEDYDLAT